MTAEHLAEIKARADAASEGPWSVRITRNVDYDQEGNARPDDEYAVLDREGVLVVDAEADDITDAVFIAAARQDIPDLLEALSESKAVIRTLKDARAGACIDIERLQARVAELEGGIVAMRACHASNVVTPLPASATIEFCDIMLKQESSNGT